MPYVDLSDVAAANSPPDYAYWVRDTYQLPARYISAVDATAACSVLFACGLRSGCDLIGIRDRWRFFTRAVVASNNGWTYVAARDAHAGRRCCAKQRLFCTGAGVTCLRRCSSFARTTPAAAYALCCAGVEGRGGLPPRRRHITTSPTVPPVIPLLLFTAVRIVGHSILPTPYRRLDPCPPVTAWLG